MYIFNIQNYPYRFKNFRIKEQFLFYAYCVWGWGGPACFLIAALTTHHIAGDHLRPGFGEFGCWFSGKFQRNIPVPTKKIQRAAYFAASP